MSDLTITYAGVDYLDRTRPLVDGTVKPKGVDMRHISLDPSELFRRVAQNDEFDAAEMSSSTYMNLLARGDDRYVAIPVFPSRSFRHSCMFVSAKSGIEQPADLQGRKVGVPEYQMTAAVWQRAVLAEDYGVAPGSIHWFQGGEFSPVYLERNAIPDPPGVTIDMIPSDKTLMGMLETGELDALFSPNRPPAMTDGSGRVRRLFPNFVEVEQDYYRRTGYFPIMHLVVIRRDVYLANRWLPVSLLDAFVDAQRVGWERLVRSGALAVILPWLMRDVEEAAEIMGPDHWPQGFAANRRNVEALCRYHYDQGLSDRLLTPEEMFVPETHQAPVSAKRYRGYAG